MIGLMPVKGFVSLFSILIHYRFSPVTLMKLSTCVVSIVCKSFLLSKIMPRKPIFRGRKVRILDLSKQQGILSCEIKMERIKLFDNTVMTGVTSGESSY